MLWAQIVAALVILLVVTYLLQMVLPRSRSNGIPRRQYLRWDVAPVVGFFGALLFGLSLALAAQQEVIVQWGWGLAFGVIVGAGAWVLRSRGKNRPAQAASGPWAYLQRYGKFALAAAIGLYLSLRVLGAGFEVFAGAAVAVLILASAAAMFIENRPIGEKSNGK